MLEKRIDTLNRMLSVIKEIEGYLDSDREWKLHTLLKEIVTEQIEFLGSLAKSA